jgi:hypothetical protein
MGGDAIARHRSTPRGLRTWHAQNLLAREPGDLQFDCSLLRSAPHREGVGMSLKDLASAEKGQPVLHRELLDLAQYTLRTVQRDAEFVLLRGYPGVFGEASGPSILVRAPAADHPSLACLRRMQGEYALRSELDCAYVVRSLYLLQERDRPMLVLEDPGGTPLDLLLNGAMEVAQALRWPSVSLLRLGTYTPMVSCTTTSSRPTFW